MSSQINSSSLFQMDSSGLCDSSMDQSGLSMDTSASDYSRDPVVLDIDGELGHLLPNLKKRI